MLYPPPPPAPPPPAGASRPPPPPATPPQPSGPSAALARVRSNPAPLGSFACSLLAAVVFFVSRGNDSSSIDGTAGALTLAGVSMIVGAVGLVTALKYGRTAALLSVAGLAIGLVVLIVGLTAPTTG